MMDVLAYVQFDPQKQGAQYLEDLATGYWFSEVLFTAVEMDLFTLLDPQGMSLGELSLALQVNAGSLGRFMHALDTLGLVTRHLDYYSNTAIAASYLVTGKENYLGDSILWRKTLSAGWRNLRNCLLAGGRIDYAPDDEDEDQAIKRIRRYIIAMDCVARTKVLEILPVFRDIGFTGQILDVGAGSGAVAAGFLRQYPDIKATLLDLSRVLDYARELLGEAGLTERTNCISANLLEPWPVNDKFKLVIMSNIIHAYAEGEISAILSKAARCMADDGYLLVHDFFLQHFSAKAALFDLNMFVHTYNGKVFDSHWVEQQLTALHLITTGLIPLATDTGIIIAAKNKEQLLKLNVEANRTSRSKS